MKEKKKDDMHLKTKKAWEKYMNIKNGKQRRTIYQDNKKSRSNTLCLEKKALFSKDHERKPKQLT